MVSETFEARINLEFSNRTHTLFGEGAEARSFVGNEGVIRVDFNTRPPVFIYELARFDMGMIYELDSQNFTICHTRSATGHIPAYWGWLSNATYAGQQSYRGQLFDWWNSTSIVSGITFHFAAAFKDAGSAAPTIPAFSAVFWEYNNMFERRTIGYDVFLPNVTNPATVFAVPKQCGGTQLFY